VGDGGDFHQCAAEQGRAHRGPHWPWLSEVLFVDRVEALEVGQVGQMDQARYDVGERAPGRGEQRVGLAERVPDLLLEGAARASLAGQENPLTDGDVTATLSVIAPPRLSVSGP